MDYKIREWNSSTGAEIREVGYLKSVHYFGRCNTSTDLRYGNLFDETLTVEVFNSSETRLTVGAYISCEVSNNPPITGQQWPQYTFYGYFKIDSITDIKGGYVVRAYNTLHDLNIDYSVRLKELATNNSFPMSLLSLVQDACTYAGISFGGSTRTYWQNVSIKKFYSAGITVAGILRYAAELAAGNVADGRNTDRTIPATMPTTQSVKFVSYASADDHTTDNVQYYYLIAPTDAAVDTSYFDASTRALFKQIFYKQDGLDISDYKLKLIRYFNVRNSFGEIVSSATAYLPGINNTLDIVSNPLIDATVGNYINLASDSMDIQTDISDTCVGTIRLFPFFCPFKLGDHICVTNGDGKNFRFNVMEMDYSDTEVVLRATGNEYYDTAQSSYRTEGEIGTSNSALINDINDGKADVSMLANGEVKFTTFPLPASGSLALTIPNASRHLVFVSSANNTTKGMTIINATSGGAVNSFVVGSLGSNLTVATGTNTYTLTNGSTSAGFVCVLTFSGDAPT